MADHQAKRLAVHAARAATGPDSARIYLLYRGVALSGDVEAQPFGANLTEICAARRQR